MSQKRGAPSTRSFTEPFTFHFKKDLKRIYKAICALSDEDEDVNMGVMINDLVRQHLLKHKDVSYSEDKDGRRIKATITGKRGTLTVDLEHNLEVE